MKYLCYIDSMLDIFAPHDKPNSKCWQVFDPIMQGWPKAHLMGRGEKSGFLEQSPGWEWETDRPIMFWGLGGSNKEAYMQACWRTPRPFYFADMPYTNRWMGEHTAETCHWRIVKDALNITHNRWHLPQDRAKKQGLICKEWQTKGRHILVCPSSDTMTRLCTPGGMSAKNWAENMVADLRELTDREIRVRYKPRANGTSGPMAASVPLSEDLKDCHAIVTLVSSAAVEAVMAGIPSFCSTYSAAVPVSNCDINCIETPHYDNRRDSWLNSIAYSQFTKEEMRSGEAYDILTMLDD